MISLHNFFRWLTLAVVSLLFSCSSGDREGPRDGSPIPSPMLSNENRKAESELRLDKEFFRESLIGLSQRFQLTDLGQSGSKAGLEIRLWSIPSLACPSVLILNRTTEGWEGRLLFPRVQTQDDSSLQACSFVISAVQPRFSWNSVETTLAENGIVLPLRLSPDDNRYPPIPDESAILLEMRDGPQHDWIGYSEFTRSIDGKKLFDLCSKLEWELAVTIGCFQSGQR